MAYIVLPAANLTLGSVQAALALAFERAGLDTPALDARWLITGVLGLEPNATLIMPCRSVSLAEIVLINEVAYRRLAREPVSRILRRREFYGLELEIGPATLDPRSDTEALVDGVLDLVRTGRVPGGQSPKILDLGTGSGAIMFALLSNLRSATGLAVDVDSEALEIASRNALRLGFEGRLKTLESHWLARVKGCYDLIVANPPYVETQVIPTLDPDVSKFDPWISLDGGGDGLDAYREIIPAAAMALEPGGWLVLEIGLGQQRKVRELVSQHSARLDLETYMEWPDLSGTARCVAVQSRSCAAAKIPLGFVGQSR